MKTDKSVWDVQICPPPVLQRLSEPLRHYPHQEWLLNMSGETLRTLLWAVGLYGTNINAHYEKARAYPKPTFKPEHVEGAEFVLGQTLDEVAQIQSGKEFELEHGDAYPAPAFTQAFNGYLAEEKHSAWAVYIGEPQFHALLTRLNWVHNRTPSYSPGYQFQPPEFDVAPHLQKRLQAALWIIWACLNGLSPTLEDAKQRTGEA